VVSENIREVLEYPCCTFLYTRVAWPEVAPLRHTIVAAHRQLRWVCHVVCDVVSEPPMWRLYIDKECLTEEQKEEMREGRGPTEVLRRILGEILAGLEV